MAIYVGDKRYAPYIGDKRRGVRNKKALPYDAEVEYLGNTGTQYIDTGVMPDQDLDFYAEFSIPQENANVNITFFQVWGATGGTNDGSYGLMNLPNSNTFQFRRWGRIWINKTSWQMLPDVKYTFHSDANKIYIDNTLMGTGSYTGDFQISYTLPLFAQLDGPHSYQSNHGITCSKAFKVYRFKLYSSGVLVRDFIPVRKGTTGYLYDAVSETLYGNSGTGDFTLGPDKIT